MGKYKTGTREISGEKLFFLTAFFEGRVVRRSGTTARFLPWGASFGAASNAVVVNNALDHLPGLLDSRFRSHDVANPLGGVTVVVGHELHEGRPHCRYSLDGDRDGDMGRKRLQRRASLSHGGGSGMYLRAWTRPLSQSLYIRHSARPSSRE